MVRAYFPQSFPGDLETNTNTPPQGTDLGGGGPPPTVSDELHEESSGVFGNLIYNDGTQSGNVKIDEGPPEPDDLELIEETLGVFDNMEFDDGVETGLVIVEETS